MNNEQLELDKKEMKDNEMQYYSEGVASGIAAFLKKNRVKLIDLEDGATVLPRFVELFLSEFDDNKLAEFPFGSSFKKFLGDKITEDSVNVTALFVYGHKDAFAGLCKMNGCAAAMEFLEANREQALKIIRNLRGD
jgi:hypothetical protein